MPWRKSLFPPLGEREAEAMVVLVGWLVQERRRGEESWCCSVMLALPALVMIFLSAALPRDPQQWLEPFWTLWSGQSSHQPIAGQPVSHVGWGGPITGSEWDRHFLILNTCAATNPLWRQPVTIVRITLLCSVFTNLLRHHPHHPGPAMGHDDRDSRHDQFYSGTTSYSSTLLHYKCCNKCC